MKTILDDDFKYIPSVSTDIRQRFIANGMKPRELGYDELERLRRFRRSIEAHATFTCKQTVVFDADLYEEMLAEADGVLNDH